MKLLSTLLLAALILCVNNGTAAINADTVSQHQSLLNNDSVAVANSPMHSDDDFAPGLFVFAVLGLACICAFVGVGIAFTFIGFTALAGFITVGIVSASIIVTIHQKSIKRGFKAFVVLGSLFAGLFSMGALFTIVNYITHWFTLLQALIAGGVTGLIAGFIMGQVLFVIASRLILNLKRQFG